MDETRVGLHTVRGRRLTARGVKPIGVHQHRFENLYVYGAIAPSSGENLFMVSATMTAGVFQEFVTRIGEQKPDTLNVVVLDNSRTHRARDLVLPPNVVLLFQPPYAPEVNPAERVWQALKAALAWERYDTLWALCQRVVALVEGWSDQMLQSLTAYPYIMSALNAVRL